MEPGRELEAGAVAIALKTGRAEARLLPEQKERIERADGLVGLSVSDFMVRHADEAAIRTIQQHTSWTLDDRDRDAFAALLLNPPEPSARMKIAVRRFKERSAP
jgi:uncharacterized protein (DUF1778 family)